MNEADVVLVNPNNERPLRHVDGCLVDDAGGTFPIIKGVPRFCDVSNYTESFGLQWNMFSRTQIDDPERQLTLSSDRFFATTGWPRGGMYGKTVLEVGSGAGRFSQVVLQQTEALLWSVDYSDAVTANWQQNSIGNANRFHLSQASVYEMPFLSGTFDKVFCMGVLQHTPDFKASVEALISKAKIGGEIVVDFYEVRGFWTKLHAKYLLRPATKRLSHATLLRLIGRNVDWMIRAAQKLKKAGLGPLTRFIPLVDLQTLPQNLPDAELREWAILDTFDMFSPEYDSPQRIDNVRRMFERSGARVTYAGEVHFSGGRGAVVRGVRER